MNESMGEGKAMAGTAFNFFEKLEEKKRRDVYILCREKEGEGGRMSHLYCSNVMHGNIFNEIRVFPPATFC